jgi:NADP-dependent 3-hydroxy acid dehydrogenase YdfG
MSQTILITGASSGFGRLTAERLAALSHKVFAGFRSVGARKQVAEGLRAKQIEVIELDVADQSSVDSAVSEVLEKSGGKLDVVINNAGLTAAGISETFTAEQTRDMFEVNVFGVQRVLRATLPTLRAQRSGLVVNIGSILGRVTLPFFGLYGASKAAIEALTDSYRYELSQLGVDVVLIQPSAYPTNMYAVAQQAADPGRASEYGDVAQIPGKILQTFADLFQGKAAPNPVDVAHAIDKVIAMPAGQRPDRIVVGLPFGSDAVNAAVAPIQNGLMENLGLASLTNLKLR